MTSVVELTKTGRELGYEGEELRNFVTQEQAREREERHDRLEAEKARLAAIEAEREAEKDRLAAEKDRREAERERQRKIG